MEEKLGLKSPLESNYPFQLLVETSGSTEQHDMEKLNTFLETVLSEGLVSDGIVAQDSNQVQVIILPLFYIETVLLNA